MPETLDPPVLTQPLVVDSHGHSSPSLPPELLADAARRLGWLALICTLRGVSLLWLPHTLQADPAALNIFAVFYGLDWIATVPPTVRLTTESFW